MPRYWYSGSVGFINKLLVLFDRSLFKQLQLGSDQTYTSSSVLVEVNKCLFSNGHVPGPGLTSSETMTSSLPIRPFIPGTHVSFKRKPMSAVVGV